MRGRTFWALGSEPRMKIRHMVSFNSGLSNWWRRPGSGVPFPATFFLPISSNASNFRFWSRWYFFDRFRLSLKSLSFFFNFYKFACQVLNSFRLFSIIRFSSFFLYKTTRTSFSTFICLFISSCFRVSFVSGAGAFFILEVRSLHRQLILQRLMKQTVVSLEDVGVESGGT